MRNEISPLFELDKLFKLPSRNRLASPPAKRNGSAKPATKEEVTAQAFDFNEAIQVDYKQADYAESSSWSAEVAGEAAYVEPFEELMIDDGTKINDDNQTNLFTNSGDDNLTTSDLPDENRLQISDADEQTAGYRAAEMTRSFASTGLAQQLADVERDLESLREQQAAAQPPNIVTPEEATEGAPANAPPQPKRGHEVFDAMARGMEYVNTFTLPPVALERLFGELDAELDSKPPVTQSSQMEMYRPETDEVLARDLEAFIPQPAPADMPAQEIKTEIPADAPTSDAEVAIERGEDDAQ